MELIDWEDRAKFGGVQGIYVVINRVSRDRFVGSTQNVRRSVEEHRTALEEDCAVAMPRMLKDFQSFGIDSFRFGVVERVRDESGLERHLKGWCVLLRPYYNPEHEYKAGNWVELAHDIKEHLNVLLH